MIEIPLPEKISTNIFYSLHFTIKGKVVKKFHEAVYWEVKAQKVKPIVNYPIRSKYTFFFAKRPLDAINCGAMVKSIEDGFRASGTLEEDSPEFVSEITIAVKKSEKKYDYCQVELST